MHYLRSYCFFPSYTIFFEAREIKFHVVTTLIIVQSKSVNVNTVRRWGCWLVFNVNDERKYEHACSKHTDILNVLIWYNNFTLRSLSDLVFIPLFLFLIRAFLIRKMCGKFPNSIHRSEAFVT